MKRLVYMNWLAIFGLTGIMGWYIAGAQERGLRAADAVLVLDAIALALNFWVLWCRAPDDEE